MRKLLAKIVTFISTCRFWGQVVITYFTGQTLLRQRWTQSRNFYGKRITQKIILSVILLMIASLAFSIFEPLLAYANSIPQDDLNSIKLDTVWYKTYPDCNNEGSGSATISPGPVYFVGDSIGTQVQGSLASAFSGQGWQLQANAVSGRNLVGTPPSPDGLGAIDQDQAFIKTAHAVVVELGTNTAGFSAQNVGQMISKIKSLAPSAIIYWVDTAVVVRQDYAQSLDNVNSTIETQASQQNFKVIPWNKKVFGDSADPTHINANAPDGGYIRHSDEYVHLTDQGISAMSSLIDSTVTGGSTGTSGSGATGVTCCPSSSVNLIGSTNAEKAYNFFISKGLTPVQAVGILGNLQAESGINPHRVQNTHTPQGDKDNITVDGVTGYGIAQWTSSNRQQALVTYAASVGGGTGDLSVQLGFLYLEATTGSRAGAWAKQTQQTDVQSATFAWEDDYEAPSSHHQTLRVQFANSFLVQYGSGGTSGTGSSPSGTACAQTGQAKDIQYKDRAELVSRILNNTKFQVSTKHNNPVVSDVQTVWAPVANGNTAGTQDAILRTLVIILEQYAQPNNLAIPIELFNRNQSPCGDFAQGATNYGPYTSSHAYGLAMDIDTTSMTAANITGLFTWIYNNRSVLHVGELEHSPVPSGAQNIKFGGDYNYPAPVQADHQDHIHVGATGTGARAPTCQPKPGGENV